MFYNITRHPITNDQYNILPLLAMDILIETFLIEQDAWTNVLNFCTERYNIMHSLHISITIDQYQKGIELLWFVLN